MKRQIMRLKGDGDASLKQPWINHAHINYMSRVHNRLQDEFKLCGIMKLLITVKKNPGRNVVFEIVLQVGLRDEVSWLGSGATRIGVHAFVSDQRHL
ncbi:hypothetical protein L1987_17337 [Smallanthus sonchifolius]|uniref:Uncharacterized protein n=1 Tax=Smallanthus sonchifolius TaxID=185202 RepID=A0ACB9IYU5_9ASTR|nr:hypothetical protein L1987_17337 [Smallanthus sonchifolius]